MKKYLHEKLLQDTEELKSILKECSTHSVVGMSAIKLLRMPEKTYNLLSPYRQIHFLLGMMLTTPEPDKPIDFDEKYWDKSVELLNAIFGSYGSMYFSGKLNFEAEVKDSDPSKRIAMIAFLHYFNSGLMATTPQLRERIRDYLCRFDSPLKELIGISASESLSIADWICEEFQKDFDSLPKVKEEEEKARHQFLDKAKAEKWDFVRMKEEVRASNYSKVAEQLFDSFEKLFIIEKNRLLQVFGEPKTEAFWNQFVLQRGTLIELTYITEHNIVDERPIFELSPDKAICPCPHSLYIAILTSGERSLLGSNTNRSYLTSRDNTLEEETYKKILNLFKDNAIIVRKVYESDSLQNEHDIVVFWNRNLLIIEAKASPPVEPLRDPQKAYVRIKDHFSSDRGIQKAYEQANHVRKILVEKGRLELFNKKKKCVLDISVSEINHIFEICVSRDNFGALAVNLSFLLQKEPSDPYPWAVNILDLANIIDVYDYFDFGADRFCQFLKEREKLHGKVESDDELGIVAFDLNNGGLGKLIDAKTDFILLDPTFSKVFEDVFYARHGGPTAKLIPSEELEIINTQEFREKMLSGMKQPKLDQPLRKSKKIGRNDNCPCGSGKKFKRCCISKYG